MTYLLRIMLISAVMCVFLFWPGIVSAEYTVTEILFIPWGEQEGELSIAEPYREYHDGPDIDTVGHMVPEGGPEEPLVDREENIYFISYSLSYLKGFDIDGNVIVNYSHGKTQFNDEFFRGMFRGFYVDSLGRIYCNGNDIVGPYVAMADRNNNLLDKLNPLGVESGIACTMLRWGSDDVLTFLSLEGGNYTYTNGEFYQGGSIFWRAGDGKYYDVNRRDSSTFRFIRAEDPDTAGRFSIADTIYVDFTAGNLTLADLMGVDDSLRFYVKYWDASDSAKGIQVYDYNYILLDEFPLLPREENEYLWYIDDIFLRHDGNVYEFHCRDDGMHVFRWSKQ